MSLKDAEAQRQIDQMVNFILNEARDKAQEIEAKALEDFNIEKLKLVQQMKNQVRQEYQQKAKQLETQRAISRSTAINKSRLRKFGARNAVIDEVVNGALHQLAKLSNESADKYTHLVTDLLTQGALMLLEKELYVCCRQQDERLIQKCLGSAEKAYTDIIKRTTGVNLSLKLVIDKDNYLPAAPQKGKEAAKTCVGGVILTTTNRKITVDNTLDARLNLVMKQCLPTIRQLLFPVQ